MKKRKLLLFLCLLLTLCLVSGCAYLPALMSLGLYSMGSTMQSSSQHAVIDSTDDTVTISREDYERYRQFDKLLLLMDAANYYFYEDVDNEALLEGAAAGLLTGLGDPYSFYYTEEEINKFWEDDKGEYAGVGMLISGNNLTGLCTISRVFEGSPAQAAGVLRGDILYMVEDAENAPIYVNSRTLDAAVAVMRGTPGTDVNVTFLRNGEKLTFTITRAVVNVTRVQSMMLEDDIGYIALYNFEGNCAEKFAEAVASLTAQNARGIIIDLRDNPGGAVSDAVSIADLFVDAGVVCTTVDRYDRKYSYRSTNGKTDVELVVMMNENSASASEILCGCLKDRTSATVVGTQSYGKGIVQSLMDIGDGSAFQVTVAQYYTPNGNSVHKIGITPDVEVYLDEGDNGMHELGDLTDAQLARALAVMQEKLAAK